MTVKLSGFTYQKTKSFWYYTTTGMDFWKRVDSIALSIALDYIHQLEEIYIRNEEDKDNE